jgi:hypothetical protein
MNRQTRSPGVRPRLLAVVAVVLLGASVAHGQSIRLHNETTIPVLVQGSAVVRGALVRDRPYLLNPGDKTPGIRMVGNMLVTVSEANVPNRVLFKGVIPAGMDDQAFNILSDGTRMKVEKRKAKRSERPNRD